MKWPWTLERELTPELTAAITDRPPEPAFGSWRIEKDPHKEKFYAQRYGYHLGQMAAVGMYNPLQNYRPWWFSEYTADSEADARAWIVREKQRPIIVAEIAP